MNVEIKGMTPLLQVYDMPTAMAFYKDLLGFEVVAQSRPGPKFDWVWLKLNGAELMLNTAYEEECRPAVQDRTRVAAHDDTCLYFGCPDVDAMYEYLKGKGVAAEKPRIAHYGMKQMYLKDPDGFAICFQWTAERKQGSAE
jgi:glyoxylase I family protein